MKSFITRDISLLAALIVIVLLVNIPVISFDMVYFEQATLYSANQMISGLKDLVDVYLHPRLLQFAIPFFRPSGHFLIYQLITPFLGWHHTKGLFVINFLFLALAGLFIIKLYNALFPRYKTGGYIAFSIYVMHPLLNQARLTVMHFEFAYIFFCMLSLYLFVRFCQKNTDPAVEISKIKFKYLHLFLLSLFFYIVAVTFKEPSIMLGPVFLTYFCIQFYAGGSAPSYMKALCASRQIRELAALVTVCAFTLVGYVTMPWADSTVSHPLRPINIGNMIAAANAFLSQLFSLGFNLIPYGELPMPWMTWRHISFPATTSYLLWVLLAVVPVSLLLLSGSESTNSNAYKKSLLFLFASAFLFVLLPLLWGMGLPWHLSLTLICLSLVMGFGVEYLCCRLLHNQRAATAFCLLFALLTAAMTINVNKLNIHAFKTENRDFYFALKLNRNALSAPPAIKSKLDPNSILLIENSVIKDDYSIGNAIYPYFISMGPGAEYAIKYQYIFFSRFDPTYNGSLFRWAYEMPSLKEEVYPFRVSEMKKVPDEIIYNWLLNYDYIFCLGYDDKANWHDRTSSFKTALLQEKDRRQMVVNAFDIKPASAFNGNIFKVNTLPYPDPQLCQYNCDQNALCKGFNYIYSVFRNHSIIQCQYYDLVADNTKFCAACTGYLKP